jgi:hypothetical protein
MAGFVRVLPAPVVPPPAASSIMQASGSGGGWGNESVKGTPPAAAAHRAVQQVLSDSMRMRYACPPLCLPNAYGTDMLTERL